MQVTATSENLDPFVYQYSSTIGTKAFRKAISDFLGRQMKVQVQISNICPSFGNSTALGTIARTVAKPGDLVVVEDFTYYLAGAVLISALLF